MFGIIAFVLGVTALIAAVGLVVWSRKNPVVDTLLAEHEAEQAEAKVEDQPEFVEPGTLVLSEDGKPYVADLVTMPAFMYELWKVNMVNAGVKVTHEQDMHNGLVTAAVLVPQEPGACGHPECQPGYEAPEDNGDTSTGGMYL
jgi:hypothetical protein